MNTQNSLVATATDAERVTFYKKTYLHVAFSVLAFIIVETLLLKIVPTETIVWMISGRFIWLFMIGLVSLGSMLSTRMSFSPTRNQQYLGLGLYIVLQAIIFMPLIVIAVVNTGGANVIVQAAIITLAMFAGLTAVALFGKADFSFLRTALVIGGFIALGTIVVGAIFGFDLGLWFSVAMVVFASGSILYNTSQIKNQYGTEQYVGAALQLFASVMLLFWYILRILSSRRR